MASGFTTILIPVTDVEKAKAVYNTLLGTAPSIEQPYYVHYEANGQVVGLVPNGHAQGMTAPVAYLAVDDIEASLAALVAAGATVKQEPTEVGGGRKVATIVDADGNATGLMQG